MVFKRSALRKMPKGGSKDLISCLPCDVIDCIMDHLTLHDVARMAVLSRRWRDIWKSLAHLRFDAQFFRKVFRKGLIEDAEFYYIISKVLLAHKGSIAQFFLHIPYEMLNSPPIYPFMNFLSFNGVREITIENSRICSPILLPSDMYSCVELRCLKLDFCTIKVPPTYKGFMKLIKLELVNVRFASDDAFESFVSSCPLLENLILNGLSGGVDHPTISAPKLKQLEVLGTFKAIALRSCQGLQSIEIGLLERVPNNHNNKASDLFEFLSSCKIQELSVKGYFFEFLSTPCYWEKSKRTFKDLKLLQLSNVDVNSIYQFTYACGLIQSCPNMEEFIISFRSNGCLMEYKVASDACFNLCRLRKLCVYSVTGAVGELNLIKFLLSCSPVLEKVYVKKTRSLEECRLSRILLRFPRASTKAEIILLDN